MFHWLTTLTLNQRLALLAIVLGLVAVAAKPSREATVSINPQDLALIVQREADHVAATTVADQLLTGQAGFRLIDVRDEAAFAAYHLPTAENIPIAALAGAGLPRNEKILLYAEDEVHAAQAWFLLKAQGYRGAYILRGGLAEWRDQVLSPLLIADAATPEQRQENDRRTAVAAFFGGAPRAARAAAATVAGVTPAPPVAMAVAAAPTLPSVAAKPKPVVKKKEGC